MEKELVLVLVYLVTKEWVIIQPQDIEMYFHMVQSKNIWLRIANSYHSVCQYLMSQIFRLYGNPAMQICDNDCSDPNIAGTQSEQY